MFPPTKQIVVFANQSQEKSVVRNRATLLDIIPCISLLELVKTHYIHQQVATARYFCVREKNRQITTRQTQVVYYSK